VRHSSPFRAVQVQPAAGGAGTVLGAAPRTPRRVAVFRPLPFGDLLLSVPALRALRAHAPHARVTLIGLPWTHEFAARFPRYVDEFLPFPGAPGLPEQPAQPDLLERFFHAAHAARFDLALQLYGANDRANTIVDQLGAAACAGFVRGAARNGFMSWPDRGSEIARCLAPVAALGIEVAAGTALEFPLTDADRAEARALLEHHGLRPGAYACIHPGASLRSRRWPIGRFRAVGAALAQRGWRIALTGSGSEAILTEALATGLNGAGVDLAGKTHLGSLAALIAGSRLLVCNDTGVSHLAAALGTPSVVVACGSDVERWAPLDRQRHRVLAVDLPCRPCANFECPIGHPCATKLPATAAIEASQELMRDFANRAPDDAR
jgi:ADP-heptose:LPS heptosyltransferase